MTEGEYGSSTLQRSKLNAGGLDLIRLHNIWERCHVAKRSGRLSNWNDELDCAWTELAGDLDPKSNKELFDQYNLLIKLIVKYRRDKVILNQILMRKQIFLKRLQNKLGKGTAYIEDGQDDFE